MNKRVIVFLGLTAVVLTIIDWVVYSGVQEVLAEDIYGYLVNNVAIMAIVGVLLYLAKIVYKKNALKK